MSLNMILVPESFKQTVMVSVNIYILISTILSNERDSYLLSLFARCHGQHGLPLGGSDALSVPLCNHGALMAQECIKASFIKG